MADGGPFEELVVAWNGSHRARVALDWAVGRRRTRVVRLVTVPQAADGAEAPSPPVGTAVARVRAMRPDLRVSGEVLHGDVERALLLQAAPGRLLVLGTGGPDGEHLPTRSDLLARIARHADGPVALVPQHGGDPAGPVAAGVDGTPAGAVAAQVAAAEADAEGRPMICVRVQSGGRVPPGWPGGPMDRAALELRERFPHLLVRQRMVRGDVHAELLRSAGAASLIVLGRHDRPGPGAELERDALIGSSCPVLLVREADALWAPAVAVPARATR